MATLHLPVETYLKQLVEAVRKSRKLARRSGLLALFCGSTATARTKAAEAVAQDLGLKLHRVELSKLVSKYIGETEKNLEAVLVSAQASDVVLLFDEADALFGQRTGVEGSGDSYANLEVSYLLQRLEKYQGLVILASNEKPKLDPAFTRRLACVVEFPRPGPEDRVGVWRGRMGAG